MNEFDENENMGTEDQNMLDQGETLESFIEKFGTQNGADPEFHQEIPKMANLARNQMPDKSDADIINVIKTHGPAIAQQMAPEFQQLPGFDAGKYQALQSSFNNEFGAEAQDLQRKKLRNANVGLEAGRALSIGSRIAAGPEYSGMLNEQYTSGKKRIEEAIMGDWEARRKAKVAEMEQMVKNGEINAKQVQAETNNFALEQLRTEAADKKALAIAGNDPNSLVSQGARAIVAKGMPDIVEQIGEERFNGLTRQQIIQLIPFAEKRITAQEKQGLADAKASSESREKQLDRESKERANANKKGGALVPTEEGKITGLRTDKEGNVSLSEDVRKAMGPLATSYENALRGLKEVETVLPQIENASESGIGSAITKAQRFVGIESNRRKADESLSRFANAMLPMLESPLMKGSPSEADARRALSIIQDPQSSNVQKNESVAALKNALDESVSRYASTYNQFDEPTKQRLAGIGARAPKNANSTDMQIPPAVQAGRDSDSLALLQEELANEKDPTNRAALEREIARMTIKAGKGVAPVAKSNAVPKTNSKGWMLMTDANGRRAYVSPDKTQFEEVK